MAGNEFSDVTKEYLQEFYCILDEMIAGMTMAKLTDSISHNFIVQMIPHHEAAIEMSENLLNYTIFIPLQNIAKNIIREQSEGIQEMQKILESCGQLKNARCDIMSYKRKYDDISEHMFTNMGNAVSVNDINVNYMREMIPHHMGAIQMSQNALQYELCSELKPILQRIITTQQQGIKEMKRLLQQCNSEIK
ncbi:MAG: DUF305 domain-containing protein [Bacteroides sp.]|nr:DUF305 domain-containing protein [Bacteroides sp.]MCM1549934.1 DUF305 domain-containing protein [Clostridium sp.]